MADKILNTRILLKHATLDEWNSSSLILKKGEVAFATVPTAEGSTLEPVMFKVGDGSKTFAQLDWASAKAADVYGWAKAAGLPVDATKAPEGQFVEGFAWENNKLVPKFRGFITEINEANKDKLDAPTTKAVKDYVDAEVQKAVSGGVEGLATEQYVDDAITALSADGGAIKAVVDDLAAHEQAFGEFQTANTKAIADAVAAEAAIARAAEKANADAINAIEADYLKAADLNDYAKTADVVTNDEFTAFEGTNTAAIADAKKAGTDAQATANEALGKIDTFLESEEVDATVNTLKEIQTELDKLADATEMVEALSKKVDKETYETDLATQDSRDDGQDAKIQALEKKPGLDKVGTVTKVTAGEGLDGGDITVEGTISLNAATKASLALADTAVQPAAIADFASKTEVATAKQEAIDAAKTAGDLAYDSKGSAGDALNSAKAYTDELANGAVKTNSDKIAALEALDYILNGDTVILDCGGAE